LLLLLNLLDTVPLSTRTMWFLWAVLVSIVT